jgi:hypothetical protein
MAGEHDRVCTRSLLWGEVLCLTLLVVVLLVLVLLVLVLLVLVLLVLVLLVVRPAVGRGSIPECEAWRLVGRRWTKTNAVVISRFWTLSGRCAVDGTIVTARWVGLIPSLFPGSPTASSRGNSLVRPILMRHWVYTLLPTTSLVELRL